MKLEDFIVSLEEQEPPASLSLPLQALWIEATGDWDEAHSLVQTCESRTAAWVHAYLHRKEGDLGNASYWYSRAKEPVSKDSFDREWHSIAETLLKEKC